MDLSGFPVNQIPKMVKVISHRTGRYYYKPVDEAPLTHMSASGRSVGGVNGLQQYPMVWASVAAGVIGVILVVVIIVSIWVRRRCCAPPKSLEEGQLKTVYVTPMHASGTVCKGSGTVCQQQQSVPEATARALAELHIASETKHSDRVETV